MPPGSDEEPNGTVIQVFSKKHFFLVKGLKVRWWLTVAVIRLGPPSVTYFGGIIIARL